MKSHLLFLSSEQPFGACALLADGCSHVWISPQALRLPRMKPHHSNQASIGRILKYTGLFGGVQGFYALMAMVRNKITALLLKTGGMGQIDNFSRTTDLIASGTNMGLAFSAMPHIARLESERNTVAIRHYVKLVRSWVFLTALLGLSGLDCFGETGVTLSISFSLLRWFFSRHCAVEKRQCSKVYTD